LEEYLDVVFMECGRVDKGHEDPLVLGNPEEDQSDSNSLVHGEIAHTIRERGLCG
jgi:hypothetical protein